MVEIGVERVGPAAAAQSLAGAERLVAGVLAGVARLASRVPAVAARSLAWVRAWPEGVSAAPQESPPWCFCHPSSVLRYTFPSRPA